MPRENINGVGEFGTLFRTESGYCSAIFNDKGVLIRLFLPASKERAGNFIGNKTRKRYPELENKIQAYFRGEKVDFKSFKLPLDEFPLFKRDVYKALLKVKRGEVLTYGELADKAGYPGAARAVGSAMAKNPIPLIIPCHRVVRSDGKLGNFTADGGSAFKRKMQELERKAP